MIWAESITDVWETESLANPNPTLPIVAKMIWLSSSTSISLIGWVVSSPKLVLVSVPLNSRVSLDESAFNVNKNDLTLAFFLIFSFKFEISLS